MKKGKFSLGILIIIVAIVFVSFKSFLSFIFDCKDCNKFVIDHVELRTGLDIPTTVNQDCVLLENKKIHKFQFDTKEIDVHNYLTVNNFYQEGDYWIKTGNNKNNTWYAEYSLPTNELKVEIRYLDN